MDKGTIIALFDEMLDIAKKSGYVEKPYSWALYQTWKQVDKDEKKGN